MKKFIPLIEPQLCGKEKEYLTKCIESTYVSTSGEFISLFEEKLKKNTNSRYLTLVNSGTSALQLSLIASGVKPNDLILTSNYSFIATANSIAYCQADPILIDVEKDSFNIDFDLVEEFITDKCIKKNNSIYHKESQRRIAAIIPILALGNIIDPKKLKKFKKNYQIPIILDAAAAIGSKKGSQKLGDFVFDFASISFNGNKIITSGAGGAVIAKKKKDLQKITHLASTARNHPTYAHDMIGYNYRMPNINAALGLAQLEKIESFIDKKRFIFDFYMRHLESDNLKFYKEPSNFSSSRWISGMMVKNSSSSQLSSLLKFMVKKNIGASKFWIPISEQKKFKNCINHLNKTSKEISKSFIVLPSSVNLNNTDLKYIVRTISSFFNIKKT